MQNKVLKSIAFLSTFLSLLLVGCSDQKSPIKGYINEEEIQEIVTSFDDTSHFTKYSYEGELNYFDYDEELVPRSIKKRNVEFKDSLEKYSNDCSSYYLRLPLHITPTNWICKEVDNSRLSLSTRYQLESKVYRPAGLDKIYYYKRDNGGFILRTFGVNKALIIKRPSDITCRAKWNIEIEYDNNGYLVKESFATVNSSQNNKSECCYGQATYTYSV